jgi:hypothetical protein
MNGGVMQPKKRPVREIVAKLPANTMVRPGVPIQEACIGEQLVRAIPWKEYGARERKK